MDTNWLEDFVCLARTRSFTQAALERNITQPAFSRRIKSLESWAGAYLIDRASYPSRLSMAGEEFLPIAQEMLGLLSRAQEELRARRGSVVAGYRFAAPHSISIHYLAAALHAMASQIPDVKTRILSEDLHTCCQLLTDSSCDFLLCFEHPSIAMSLDLARFKRAEITQDRLLPVCIPGPGKRLKPRWQLGSLRTKSVPLLGYGEGSFFASVVTRIIGDRTQGLAVRHVDTLSEVLKRLALRGAGVAWLPESTIASELENQKLILAGDQGWSAPLTLSLFADPRQMNQRGHQIWEFLADKPPKQEPDSRSVSSGNRHTPEQ